MIANLRFFYRLFKVKVWAVPGRVIALVFFLTLIVTPLITTESYVIRVLTLAAIFAIYAASWDLLTGYTGQLNLGQALFFGVAAYAAALTRNGFFGPHSWYMNAEANAAFALRARERWRLDMPVLFLHGAFDQVCETVTSRLAEPMREWCADLTEVVVPSGHWMAQERPAEVNAALARWLGARLPGLWLGA